MHVLVTLVVFPVLENLTLSLQEITETDRVSTVKSLLFAFTGMSAQTILRMERLERHID